VTAASPELPAEVHAARTGLVAFHYDPQQARATHIPPDLAAALERYLAARQAENTRRGYESDWGRFAAWCSAQRLDALPALPLTVALYLVDAAEQLDERSGRHRYAPTTLTRWTAAIAAVHAAAGRPSPTADPLVRATLRGIRRSRRHSAARKSALLLDDVKQLLQQLPAPGWPTGAARRRDRALLLFGFAGAFRRSELVAVDVADVTLHRADGLHVRLRASKTDQEGRSCQLKPLPYGAHPQTCPVCAYLDWREVLDAYDAGGSPAVRRRLEAEQRTWQRHRCRDPFPEPALPAARPLFRPISRHGHLRPDRLTGQSIAGIVQRYAQRAGLNPQLFAGHSLRAGFVTQAARNKASSRAIMRQTGHRSAAMVDVYVRRADPLADNAVTELGL